MNPKQKNELPKSDTVRFTVVIPRTAYDHMKEKASTADISMNKFLCRAGSVVTAQQVAHPPGFNYSGGVPTLDEVKNS